MAANEKEAILFQANRYLLFLLSPHINNFFSFIAKDKYLEYWIASNDLIEINNWYKACTNATPWYDVAGTYQLL